MTLLITVLFIPVLQEMRFETDLDNFLPEDDVIQADRRVSGYFGETPEPQYLLVRGENVLSAPALREELNISLHAGYIDGVVGTLSLAGVLDEVCKWSCADGAWRRDPARGLLNISDGEVEAARDTALQLLDPGLNLSALPLPPSVEPGDLQLLVASFLPRDFHFGDRSARRTVVVANLNGSWSGEARKSAAALVVKRVGALRLNEVSFQATSTPLITREVDRATVEDNLPIALTILTVVCVILALSFRGLSYVLLPVAAIVMAGVWTFGVAMFLGIRLIAIDIAVIPLIVGLGVDYFIHVSARYQEELRGNGSPGRAMSAALRGIFAPLSLALVTTIASFITNVFTGIQPIREFGLLCALGVGSCALLSVTFYPACRILVDRRSRNPRVRSLRDVRLFSHGIALGAQTVRRYPAVVLALVAALSAGALFGALNLRTEFGVEDFVQESWPEMRAVREMRDAFPAASMYQSYVLLEGEVATPAALRTIHAIHRAAEGDRYVVRANVSGAEVPKVQSVVSVIRSAARLDPSVCERYRVDTDGGPMANCTAADVAALLDFLRSSGTFSEALGGVVHFGKGYDAAVVRVYNFVRDTSEGRQMYSELLADAGGRGAVTGGVILTLRTLDAFRESQVSSTIFAILFAAVFLIVVYRNVALGVVSILPVVISSLWVLGTMYILSISLNALTLTVTALTIGLGIDYTIYITQRFRQELMGRCPGEAIQTTIVNVGSAIFLCTVTTWAGFGVLCLSPMPMTQQFGLITAATILYSFTMAIFVLPILLEAYSRMRALKPGSGGERSPQGDPGGAAEGGMSGGKV
ncbi:MAG: efflux RND transporter permease subunit [Thermoplasmatota archaeon]